MKRKSKLKIAMLSAEVRPHAWVGGLSDAVTALAGALVEIGVEVAVFTPLYRRVRVNARLEKETNLTVRMGETDWPCALYRDITEQRHGQFFLECPSLFDRPGIYSDPESGEDYRDNFERFLFFTLGALEAIRRWKQKPDLIHCHDAHTSFAPALIKFLPPSDSLSRIPTLLTIHNLAYQGLDSLDKFWLTGLPPELIRPAEPFEFYGRLNTLKGGICLADLINTVSPRYAQEILTSELGCGLEGVLQQRSADLFGILNGIDDKTWNPACDPLIPWNYSRHKLHDRKNNKMHLQDIAGFAVRDVPLIGFISRLVEQKGLDLILELRNELCRMDCQWVFLGRGEARYEKALTEWSRDHPEKFALFLQYDNSLSHEIEAGSDLFLMPSRFEPCGLNQMYSLRYGAVPLVHSVGGLADTVREFDPATGKGNGFTFHEYSSQALLNALRRAISVREDPRLWNVLMENGMREDHSWRRRARKYLELYQRRPDLDPVGTISTESSS